MMYILYTYSVSKQGRDITVDLNIQAMHTHSLELALV